MLFDLRVVLSACLATLFFAVAGFCLLAAMRPSSPGGYALNGPQIAGPGLPAGKPLPVTQSPANKTDVTGSVGQPPAAKKNDPIQNLLKEQAAAPAAEEAKPRPVIAPVRKKPRVVQQPNNPFSFFINNNNSNTPQ